MPSGTILRCQHAHPVPSATRSHGAALGKKHGEWFPTGRIVELDNIQLLADLETADDTAWGYCPRCKAASEYRRRVA